MIRRLSHRTFLPRDAAANPRQCISRWHTPTAKGPLPLGLDECAILAVPTGQNKGAKTARPAGNWRGVSGLGQHGVRNSDTLRSLNYGCWGGQGRDRSGADRLRSHISARGNKIPQRICKPSVGSALARISVPRGEQPQEAGRMIPDPPSPAEVLSGVSNRSANSKPNPPSKSTPLAISREGTDGWRKLRPQQVRRGWGQESGAHCARQDSSTTQLCRWMFKR